MTEEEEASVDIAGRMAFADDVSRDVVPVIRKLPSYAGEWIDQESGGSLVVALTQTDEAARAAITELMPDDSRGLRFVQVAHTYAQLVDAIDVVDAAWENNGGPRLLSVGVDTQSNGLAVEVLSQDQVAAALTAKSVSDTFGVAVRVATAASPGGDVTCTDRDHCTDPMKAGDIMRGGSVNGTLRCTVGFQIVCQGDVQAVSAGHCSHYYDLWYHQGYGVGAFANVQDATKWHSGGRDILRMTFPDAQASHLIYGTPGPTQLASAPGVAIANETLCVSLGRSNRIDCGRVEHTSVRYWSDTIGFYVWGGDLVESDISPAPIDGDSGSPIYRERFIEQPPTSYYQRTAIGVLTTEHDEYARLDNTLADWNASIY